MRILVFGATGLTGKEVVKTALGRGHQVTAFVRSPEKLDDIDGVDVVEGDITDAAAVSAAVKDHDAVVSELGGNKPWHHSREIVTAVGHIIAACREHGVNRFVYQSALGVGESRDAIEGTVLGVAVPFLLRKPYEDHAENERAIRDSDLAWTIVRPTSLTKSEATGEWRSGPDQKNPSALNRIPRADVAAFILDELEHGGDVRQAVNLVH